MPQFIAKMLEDGKVRFTEPFSTVDEARAAGRKLWFTHRFDVLELADDNIEIGIYEAVRYVGVVDETEG